MERAKQDRPEEVKNNNSVSHFKRKAHSIGYYTKQNTDQAMSVVLKTKSSNRIAFTSS